MAKRFVNWQHYKRGVPAPARSDAKSRTCKRSDCGKQAVWAGELRTGNFTLDVWYCGDHKAVADEVNGRAA